MKGYFFSSLLLVSSLVFTVTENKDKPIKGEWDLQLKKIWEKKEAGIDSFAEVGQITSDSDGCLFVADSKYFKIFVFDQNGKFIRAFGKKGEGPGELKRLGGFHLFADQLVFFQAYKFHYFKKDGSYVKSTPIPWRFLLIDFISHNKCLGIVSKEQDKGRYKKQIIIFDIKNKNQNVIKEEPVPITGRGATERMQFNIMIPGLSPSLITYLKDDRIFYGVNNAYRIKVMDLKGTLLQDIVLKRNKTKMSLKEMEKILPEGLKKFPGIKNALLKRLPNQQTFFEKIYLDNLGFIYVFPFLYYKNKPLIFDIFSSKGEYVYRSKIEIEAGVSLLLYHFSGNHLYLCTEDEEGEIKVSKYQFANPR